MVPRARLELARLATLDPKSSASTNFATSAREKRPSKITIADGSLQIKNRTQPLLSEVFPVVFVPRHFDISGADAGSAFEIKCSLFSTPKPSISADRQGPHRTEHDQVPKHRPNEPDAPHYQQSREHNAQRRHQEFNQPHMVTSATFSLRPITGSRSAIRSQIRGTGHAEV